MEHDYINLLPSLRPDIIFWEGDTCAHLQRMDGSASFKINTTALEILRYCNGRTSLEEIVIYLRKRFQGGTADAVRGDVTSFIHWAVQQGLLNLNSSLTPISSGFELSSRCETDTVQKGCHHPADNISVHSNLPGHEDLPSTVYVSLTGRCNLHCGFCYNNSPDTIHHTDLSRQEWQTILVQLSEFMPVCSIFILTGGEPTLHPDFESVAHTARERFFRLQMYSNGTLIDKSFAGLCGRLGFEIIGISIHGARAETADSITGSSLSFERSTKAVEFLSSAGVPVAWQATITRKNLDEIPDMLKLARELGAVEFRVGSVDFPEIVGSKPGCEPLEAEEEIYLWEVISDLNREFSGDIRIGLIGGDCYGDISVLPGVSEFQADPILPSDFNSNSICCVGRKIIHIRSDGHLTPCPVLKSEFWDLGSLLRSNLNILWHAATALYPLRKHGLEDFEHCAVCGLRAYCGGGCRAGAFFASGDILGCDIKKKKAITTLLNRRGHDSHP